MVAVFSVVIVFLQVSVARDERVVDELKQFTARLRSLRPEPKQRTARLIGSMWGYNGVESKSAAEIKKKKCRERREPIPGPRYPF